MSDGYSAVEAFYASTAEEVFAAVWRIVCGDKQVAHDAVQDAYLQLVKCWPARAHLPHDVNRRWVIGIAAHKVIDRYRRQCHEVDAEDDSWPAVDDPGFEVVLDEMSLLARVREVIALQPPRRRAVAVLHFLEGADYPEIAKALGMATSTVRTHVERMRGVLKPLIVRIAELDAGGGQ